MVTAMSRDVRVSQWLFWVRIDATGVCHAAVRPRIEPDDRGGLRDRPRPVHRRLSRPSDRFVSGL